MIDGSPSQKSRLEVGDEIVEVNDRPLLTADDFYQTIQIFRNALVLVLMVRKNENSLINSSYESNQNISQPSPIDDDFANRTRSSSSHQRLESIISQLSGDENEDEERSNSSSRPSSELNRPPSPPITYQRKYQIPKKTSTQFESKLI